MSMSMAMSKPRRLAADQLGDTIIEVMVVLAVLGLAIGIAYATANRSLLNARQAQENSEATGMVKAQVENLRLLSANSTPANTDPNTNIFLPTVPYCVPDPSAASPIDTNTSHCSSGSVPYSVLVYNCDKISTGPCFGASGPDTLVIQATWPDILGQGTDSVTLDYRLHP
jgi:type II secretory pathway pseudopilin PulG